MRPLARDLWVLIGWPLPLGFGLGGRLLLARRGRVYVKFIIINKERTAAARSAGPGVKGQSGCAWNWRAGRVGGAWCVEVRGSAWCVMACVVANEEEDAMRGPMTGEQYG